MLFCRCVDVSLAPFYPPSSSEDALETLSGWLRGKTNNIFWGLHSVVCVCSLYSLPRKTERYISQIAHMCHTEYMYVFSTTTSNNEILLCTWTLLTQRMWEKQHCEQHLSSNMSGGESHWLFFIWNCADTMPNMRTKPVQASAASMIGKQPILLYFYSFLFFIRALSMHGIQ